MHDKLPQKGHNHGLITSSITRSASSRYFVYSEADFEVFRPAGATRCTDGVKFGMERVLSVGPQKLKFLLRFDQNVEYKRPTGAYPLRDFHKICRANFFNPSNQSDGLLTDSHIW